MQSVLGSGFILSILIIVTTPQKAYRPQTRFYLTNSNNETREICLSKRSIEQANFLAKKLTVVLVHDFDGNVNSPFNRVVTNALTKTRDSNIITVDWIRFARSAYNAYMYVNQPAYDISVILYILCKEFNYDPKKIHIIGLGAGAHVAGVAGRLYKKYDCGRVQHITGLDPLGSFFYNNNSQIKLGKDSAKFVEVIHTNINRRSSPNDGFALPLGHLDFYPNGGSNMPGCENSRQKAVCSHYMSYIYLAEALKTDEDEGLRFVGHKCDTYQEAIEKKCRNKNELAVFGGGIKRARSDGVYYFETNPSSPYAQGDPIDSKAI